MRIPPVLRRFARRESGTSSVEFVVVLPGVVLVLLFVADVSMIVFNRSVAISIIEDANRMRAVGLLENDAAVSAHVTDALGHGRSSEAEVGSSVVGGVIQTYARMPATSLDMFGTFAVLARNPTITVSSAHFAEANNA